MAVRIGELLLKEKRITPVQLQEVLNYQKANGGKLGLNLVKLGFVKDEEITALLSRQYGVPSINLGDFQIDQTVIKLIPAETAQKYQIVPLSRSGATLTIAMTDPTNVFAMDDIKFMTGYNVEPVVASETAVTEAIRRYYPAGAAAPRVVEKKERRVVQQQAAHLNDAATLDMTKLGFEPESLKKLENAINKPWGMVLVTGPTGSGKTNTLYSSIAKINTAETNIMTAEDPVEFNLVGVNQVQVRENIGLNFAAALRSFLRQDPNIILVGEIRDFETAEIAVKASLTGHLVLSTLHTNDAPSTISRLM